MNEERRRSLRSAQKYLAMVSSILDQVRDKESDCVDNYPENLQDTDRYAAMEDAVESLDEAIENIDDAVKNIEAAIK